jgi:peroxiredoxin
MRNRTKRIVLLLAALAILATGAILAACRPSDNTIEPVVTVISASTTPNPSPTAIQYAGPIYYVDCSVSTNGVGSQTSPWNTLTTVNATTFAPGNQILFMRGTVCVGQLWPKGSGADGTPVIVSAYGTGARPIIDGNHAVAPVVMVKDQNFWRFDSLEIRNSAGLGLYVDGSPGADLYGFALTNLYVHDGGLNDGQHLILLGNYQNHSVHDVLIDNVEASNGWRGIEIGGKCCNNPPIRSTNIIIRNSVVHDVQSDGILVASTNNALIEHSVVYRSGIMATKKGHTPNGLWTWDCDDCIVQFNEVYESHSPKGDGGAFDIDYYNHRNVVQYNYGHDNDAYCVAIYGGASDDVTTNNVIRYNICSNDGRKSGNPAIYITAKRGGSVQDTFIYNNTIYWNPTNMTGQYAISLTSMDGGQAIHNTNIYNNLIYSASPNLVSIETDATQQNLDYNLYWFTGDGSPNFKLGSIYYDSLNTWQSGTGKDTHSLYTDPLVNDPTYHTIGFPTDSFTILPGSLAINAGADLVALGLVTSMGERDFYGIPIPVGGYDIGACEYSQFASSASAVQPGSQAPDFTLEAVRGESYRLRDFQDKAVLLSFINTEAMAMETPERSRSQVVFLKSMLEQYRSKGLVVLLVDTAHLRSGKHSTHDNLINFTYDWQLDTIPVFVDPNGMMARLYGISGTPTTFLIGADGVIQQRWDDMATVPQLAYAIKAQIDE